MRLQARIFFGLSVTFVYAIPIDFPTFALTPSLTPRDAPAVSDSAPISIGSSSASAFVSVTNDTRDFSSLFSLNVFSNASEVAFSANVAALTAAVGRSSTLSNGIQGICAGRLIPAVDNVYIGYPNIALINCDDPIDATNKIITYAVQSSDCVLMYSLTSNACNFTTGYRQYASQMGFVLTTMSTLVANSIVQSLNQTTNVTTAISTEASLYSPSSSSNSAANKDSNSSTVAMVVVYTIVGFVALIFLFIIISGAIRVHRHPERYGLPPPGSTDNDLANNNLQQQPYTQRAKGLARAVLDSIPLMTVRINHKSSTDDIDSSSHDDNNNNDLNLKGKVDSCSSEKLSKTNSHTSHHISKSKSLTDNKENCSILESEATHSDSYELSTFYSATTAKQSLDKSALCRSGSRKSQIRKTNESVESTVNEACFEHPATNISSQTSNMAPDVNENTSSQNNTISTPRYTYTTLTRPISLHEEDPTYSPHFLESLEQLQIDDDDDNVTCPICFEEFDDGQILRVLPCKHRFHAKCVDPWLLNSSSHCPLCRVDLSLRQHENVPDQPPGLNNNSNNDHAANHPIDIPEGYDLDTSVFNRFLDIWNAHLLPKDVRRAALARFQEEAELRRLIRSQRGHLDNNTENNNNNNTNSNTNVNNDTQIHSPAPRKQGLLGLFKLGLPSRFGRPSGSHPNPTNSETEPDINHDDEDDDLQNRRRWSKFVASRRHIHELRIGCINLHRSASILAVPSDASSVTTLNIGAQDITNNAADQSLTFQETLANRNNTRSFDAADDNSNANSTNATNDNNEQSQHRANSFLKRAQSHDNVLALFSSAPFARCHQSLGRLYPSSVSTNTEGPSRNSARTRRNSVDSHQLRSISNNFSLDPIPSLIPEQSSSIQQGLLVPSNHTDTAGTNAAAIEFSGDDSLANTCSIDPLECLYQQPATSLPIPSIPPLPPSRYQDAYKKSKS